ncbi:Serine protease [Rhyzopertha dominica]|nr:Serine protease [Rhyzopertha dominica]
MCGGSIISEIVVLTAAHCIQGQFVPAMTVRVGSAQKSSDGIVAKVARVVVHERFESLDYDIGLIKLKTALTFTSQVQPVALPSEDDVIEPGTSAVVSGWGSTTESGLQTSGTLQAVEVIVIDSNMCKSLYSEYKIRLTRRMICAGVDEGGKDSCQPSGKLFNDEHDDVAASGVLEITGWNGGNTTGWLVKYKV